MRQRDGAVLALQLFAAGAADHGKRVAAPVEQNQRLLAALQRRFGLLNQRARKELLLARLLELAPHVDQLHLGQRPVHHAVAHLDARVLAAHGILPALQRRRRRAQHHHRARQLGAHHGHVARVVARRLLLLVALVVLLVHQNQAQIRRGRKDRRARAHHDRRIAAPDAPPLLAALLGRKRGVQQRHLLPEGRVQQAGRLRRQPDLRNQQDRRKPAVQRPLHRRQIDRRLSRTRHAVQQKGMESPRARSAIVASASVCGSFSLRAQPPGAIRPGETPRAARRCAPARAAPEFAAWTKADRAGATRPAAVRRRRPPAPPESPAAFCVKGGSRASGTSTANRSIRRASRSAAAVSRAIHFLRTRPASTGSVAAVAVRSVDTFTGSPDASRASTRCSRSCSSRESFPRCLLAACLRDVILSEFAQRAVEGPAFRSSSPRESPLRIRRLRPAHRGPDR